MNPYQKWLGVNSVGPTPDYFELLGISRDESDPETIKASAVLQARKLKPYRDGKYAAPCEKILKRIQKAYKVLANPVTRQDYLSRLEQDALSRTSGVMEVDLASPDMAPVRPQPRRQAQPLHVANDQRVRARRRKPRSSQHLTRSSGLRLAAPHWPHCWDCC